MNKGMIVLLVLMVGILGWLILRQVSGSGSGSADLAGQCQELGGTYLAEYNECEWISADQCTELGGEFEECASACRNDPEAEICTMNCVQVCQL